MDCRQGQDGQRLEHDWHAEGGEVMLAHRQVLAASADLIEGDDRIEVTVSVSQVVGRLCEKRQLRLGPHPRKQPCLQQPVAVCLYVLQGITSPT